MMIVNIECRRVQEQTLVNLLSSLLVPASRNLSLFYIFVIQFLEFNCSGMLRYFPLLLAQLFLFVLSFVSFHSSVLRAFEHIISPPGTVYPLRIIYGETGARTFLKSLICFLTHSDKQTGYWIGPFIFASFLHEHDSEM